MLTALSLSAASSAYGATEVGNDCTGTNIAANYTMVQLSKAPGSPLPLTVPTAGVVTKWKVRSDYPLPESETLRVFRETAKAKDFQAVAESAEGLVVKGSSNEFSTRIPVQAGDRFGASAGPKAGLILCTGTGNPTDVMGVLVGPLPDGMTATFEPALETEVAVSAFVEPDVDGDGFGDETQDKCPASAASQTDCPPVALSSFALVKKHSVVLLVSTDAQAPVSAAGIVKLGKASKKQARQSAQLKLPAVTRTVSPGQIAQLMLQFPKALKTRLASLARSKSLKLTLTATATNSTGQTSTSKTSVKLKGHA